MLKIQPGFAAIIVIVAFIGCVAIHGQLAVGKRTKQAQSIVPQPCEVAGAEPNTKISALCSTLEVFEDRELRSGRKIALKVVIFPATGQNKEPDPLFYIPGGPGSSATEDAPYVAQDLAKVREHRDLVFVDQRGTGGSNPLNCTFFNSSDPQSYLGHWNPPDEVRKCRQELETRADLRFYTTSIAVDDLDDVRIALGYERINIHGGSYGTRATQEYVRRHRTHVRSVVLHGVSLTDQFMPRDFPRDTERALNGVIDECLADNACRTAFPNLRAEVKAVLEKLLLGPVDANVNFPEDSDTVRHVRLSRDLAAEAVRYMLYEPRGASRLPLFLHVAAEGNFKPLAQAAIYYRQNLVGTGATGLYLSITCAEDLPFISAGDGERIAENSFLGDYRLRQQREDCSLWPRSIIPKDYSSPVHSDVPALILTGQWDPVTPPQYGAIAAKNFPNSLHIIVPSGGHAFGGLKGIECISDLIAEFINRGNARGLDTSCVRSISREGFQLKF